MNQQQYIIDGGQSGKDRLKILARALQSTTAQLFDRLGMGAGMRALDVGCGGGDVTLEMARRAGSSGHVTGMDFDAAILDLARYDAETSGLHNVEFRLTNALQLAEAPVYDFVYARFLLTHLPDPSSVLASMIRAAKPGGVVVIEDIDFSGHFCYPPSTAFDRFLDLYCQAVRTKGGDPNIGLRLVDLFQQAGLADVGVHLVQPVHRVGEGKRIAEITLARVAGAVIAAGLASHEEVAAIIAELAEFAARPDTILSLPRIFQVWARRA